MGERMSNDAVDELRERFEVAPIGVWATGHSARTAQAIIFFENHSGICEVDSPGGIQTIHFEWRMHEAFSLRVREKNQATTEDRAAIEQPDDWISFVYDFELSGSEAGMRLIEFGRISEMPDLLIYQGPANGQAMTPVLKSSTRPQTEPADPLHGIFLPASFCTGLAVGVTLLALHEFQIAIDPEWAIIGTILLFFVFCCVVSWAGRLRSPRDEHGELRHD
jgi:hypothetical protein